MKNVVTFLSLLVSFSCSAQTLYPLEQAKAQEQEIYTYFNSNRKSEKTVQDIVNHVKLKILSFAPPNYDENSYVPNRLILNLYPDPEFHDLLSSRKLKYYRIHLYLKEIPPKDKTVEISKRNELEWTKEVEDFFGKYVVDSIKSY